MVERDYWEEDVLHDGEVWCPRCQGNGEVTCHCGGDQCYCDNHGYKPCGLCYGEGTTSEERSDAYLKKEAEFHKAMKEAWKKHERERTGQ